MRWKEKERWRGGDNRGEYTELHTKTATHELWRFGLACEFTEFLVSFFFFFLPCSVSLLEVYRSMTDNRELLRWFIQGQGQVFI